MIPTSHAYTVRANGEMELSVLCQRMASCGRCITQQKILSKAFVLRCFLDDELPTVTLVRMDRQATGCGKKKGRGLALFVNNRLSNPGHITVEEQLCTKDIGPHSPSVLKKKFLLKAHDAVFNSLTLIIFITLIL